MGRVPRHPRPKTEMGKDHPRHIMKKKKPSPNLKKINWAGIPLYFKLLVSPPMHPRPQNICMKTEEIGQVPLILMKPFPSAQRTYFIIPPANIVWGVYRNRPVCPDQLPHLLSDFHQTLWKLRS